MAATNIFLISLSIICLSSVAQVAAGFTGSLIHQQQQQLQQRRRIAVSRHSTLLPKMETAITTAPSLLNKDHNNADREDEAVVNVVLVTGFESFNRDLYRKAGQLLPPQLGNVNVQVFADSDIRCRTSSSSSTDNEFTKAVKNADVFIGSLIFDYDDVVAVSNLLNSHIKDGPRLIFECATELMSYNKVGSFSMDKKQEGESSVGSNSSSAPGPPPAIKAILNKFSSGKEEDKINGYLKMLKVGPDLLKFIPG